MPHAWRRCEPPPNSARLAAFSRGVLLAALAALALAAVPGLAQEPGAPLYALFQAVRTDDAELAAFALDKGADIEATGPRGLSPLRAAALLDSQQIDTGQDLASQNARLPGAN